MNILGKIFEKLQISFSWKGNKSTKVSLRNADNQIYQAEGGTTQIYNFEHLTINNIQELAGGSVQGNPETILRSAGQRLLVEQSIKQANLKSIVDKAELNDIQEPLEPEKDWFLKWMEVAQAVSREDIQVILARILAGEVKKKDAFSLRTLDIVKNLNKIDLSLFQRFCDISYSISLPEDGDAMTCVISSPYGTPGENALMPLGLSYSNLGLLQEAGLIQYDLTAWREFKQEILQIPFKIGSTTFSLAASEKLESATAVRAKCIFFTEAGLELRKVLTLGVNSEYNNKFLEWAQNTFKLAKA